MGAIIFNQEKLPPKAEPLAIDVTGAEDEYKDPQAVVVHQERVEKKANDPTLIEHNKDHWYSKRFGNLAIATDGADSNHQTPATAA